MPTVLAEIPNQAVMPAKPAESDGRTGQTRPDAESDQENDAFQYMDFIPSFREQVSCYGEDRFAPAVRRFGPRARLSARCLRERSQPRGGRGPGSSSTRRKTWAQLDALARFFQGRDWSGDGKPEHGIVLAMGSDPEGIGDALFLARAASLGQHRDHYSFLFDSDAFTSRVDSPPFVEALKGLVAWKALGPPGVERFDATAARERSVRAGPPC